MLQFNTTHVIVRDSIENIILNLHTSMNTKNGDISPEQQIKLDSLIVSISELITTQVNQNLEIEYSHTVNWPEGYFSIYLLKYWPYYKSGEITEHLYKKYGKNDCTLDSQKYHGEIWLESDRVICDDDLEISCVELIQKLSLLPIKKF